MKRSILTVVTLLGLAVPAMADDAAPERPKRPERPEGAERGERPPRGPVDPAAIFDRLDADGDGLVTLEEFKARPMARGEGRGEVDPERAAAVAQRITQAFDTMDADGSGGVSKEEFINHMKARRAEWEQRGPRPEGERPGKREE